jgi:hypothetical protein
MSFGGTQGLSTTRYQVTNLGRAVAPGTYTFLFTAVTRQENGKTDYLYLPTAATTRDVHGHTQRRGGLSDQSGCRDRLATVLRVPPTAPHATCTVSHGTNAFAQCRPAQRAGGGMRWKASAVLLNALCAVHALSAQSLNGNDRVFLEAAVVVMAYDEFAARCTQRAAFTADAAATIASWRRENDVDLVRERLKELESDPGVRQKLEQTRAAFSQQFAGVQGEMACAATVSIIQQPDAQLARKSPDLLRTLRERRAGALAQRAPGAVTRAARSTPEAQSPGPVRATSATSAAITRLIDSFGFDTRAEMGFGGFIGLKVFPVVLFRDGTALTDVGGLGFAGGLAAHRRAHPADWTRWRRQGGEIQLLDDTKWDKLAFRRTYATLPTDFRLIGRFRRLSGVGNIAVGGTQSVTAVSEYEFTADGRVVRDGAVGSTASAGGTSVVTSAVAANRRGRYTIDGITLRIRYDDGSEELRILVTDPTDPKSVIWLDGDGYVRR